MDIPVLLLFGLILPWFALHLLMAELAIFSDLLSPGVAAPW